MTNIKKVWQVEIELFELVEKICKKHNIKFFADAGTLLGAVRHKGFIPWDDDIDLVMFRKDYNKFRKVVKKELPGDFFCQDGYNDKGFYGGMLHIRKNETTAIQLKSFPNITYHQGIFIDIFPLDGVINNRVLYKIQFLIKNVLNMIMRYKNCYWEEKHGWRKILRFFCKIIPQKLIFKTFELVCSLKSVERSDYVEIVSYFGMSGRRKKTWYNSVEYLPFENTKLPAPPLCESAKILEVMYGKDFLIPKKIETDHGEMFFDTEHSYKDYISGILKIEKNG